MECGHEFCYRCLSKWTRVIFSLCSARATVLYAGKTLGRSSTRIRSPSPISWRFLMKKTRFFQKRFKSTRDEFGSCLISLSTPLILSLWRCSKQCSRSLRRRSTSSRSHIIPLHDILISHFISSTKGGQLKVLRTSSVGLFNYLGRVSQLSHSSSTFWLLFPQIQNSLNRIKKGIKVRASSRHAKAQKMAVSSCQLAKILFL